MEFYQATNRDMTRCYGSAEFFYSTRSRWLMGGYRWQAEPDHHQGSKESDAHHSKFSQNLTIGNGGERPPNAHQIDAVADESRRPVT